MRICIAGRMTGGVGVYAQTLVRALLRADAPLRIHLATPDPVPPAVAEHVTAHAVRRVHGLPTHPGWLLDAVAFRTSLRALAAQFDVVHFTDARHALFCAGLPCPVVGTMNDYFYAIVTWRPRSVSRFYRDWPVRYPLYHLARLGERRALRRMSRIIAISDAVAEVVGRQYQIPRDRFETVPYGLDFSRIPPNSGVVREPPTILFVGGNFQRKGLLTLLQALPRVLGRFPHARLSVVGRSHYAEGARRLAMRLGVAGHCDFLGALSHVDLLGHYGEASVLAMPSLLEAFGIPYLEAMSCGLPVLATRCAGPDEYLIHDRNAVVVEPGDAFGLGEGLVRLLGDPVLRNRVRQGGWETSRRFTPERMAGATLGVYRSVLGRSREEGGTGDGI